MPIIEMHLMTGRTVEQKRRVAKEVAAAAAHALDVNPATVRILISEHGPEDFSVAGVTAGQKEDFVHVARQAHAPASEL